MMMMMMLVAAVLRSAMVSCFCWSFVTQFYATLLQLIISSLRFVQILFSELSSFFIVYLDYSYGFLFFNVKFRSIQWEWNVL